MFLLHLLYLPSNPHFSPTCRQSHHEILSSIRSQDGSSDVRIESSALESVLQALDERHLFGHGYNPAAALRARAERTEGANEELREQVRLIILTWEK